MSFVVVQPGLASLLVDGGRRYSRALGVPVGGAADREAFQLANVLVGNSCDELALEITGIGPRLQALAPVGCVVFGAPFDITIDGERQLPGVSFPVETGQTLAIGGTATGVRAYLAVRGGFSGRAVLGSRGAWSSLVAGEWLNCGSHPVARRGLLTAPVEESGRVVRLRVVRGPQWDWFEPGELYSQTLTVTPASNRMGLRLRGSALRKRAGEMTSEPVAPGAIQVTNDGLPIVLGVDGQTIGGYPKPAHVIRADLDWVGRLRPGQRVEFVEVSLAEAELLWHEHEARLQDRLTSLAWALQ
jgi:5-oxoprolinase (ATP-hydrolysing) subunit C